MTSDTFVSFSKFSTVPKNEIGPTADLLRKLLPLVEDPLDREMLMDPYWSPDRDLGMCLAATLVELVNLEIQLPSDLRGEVINWVNNYEWAEDITGNIDVEDLFE
ncbi:MAG: hypothetical protein Q4P71_06060 [Actinomycetaceae bacterium]|nr:hypothetical protein [Actinomycetaceae bacterium]